MKYNFFISYSRRDSLIADEICQGFDELGISYFIDRSNIKTAAEYMSVIANNLIKCERLLFLGSINSYNSKFAIKELLYAINKDVDIVAYILDNSQMPSNVELAFSDINQQFLIDTPIPKFCESLKNLCFDRPSSIFRNIPLNLVEDLINEFVSESGIVSLDETDLEYLYHSSKIAFGIIPLSQDTTRFHEAFSLLKHDAAYKSGNYTKIAINLKVPSFDSKIIMNEMSSFVSLFGTECDVIWGCTMGGIRSELFIILSA